MNCPKLFIDYCALVLKHKDSDEIIGTRELSTLSQDDGRSGYAIVIYKRVAYHKAYDLFVPSVGPEYTYFHHKEKNIWITPFRFWRRRVNYWHTCLINLMSQGKGRSGNISDILKFNVLRGTAKARFALVHKKIPLLLYLCRHVHLFNNHSIVP